jgi:UDP-N-acetylmuramyl pentapeptide synthase
LNSELINKIQNTDKDYRFEGVSINSKKIKKNNIFICIKGERFDGHSFIKEAFKNKANFCVSEKSINHRKIIKTKNSLNFLK